MLRCHFLDEEAEESGDEDDGEGDDGEGGEDDDEDLEGFLASEGDPTQGDGEEDMRAIYHRSMLTQGDPLSIGGGCPFSIAALMRRRKPPPPPLLETLRMAGDRRGGSGARVGGRGADRGRCRMPTALLASQSSAGKCSWEANTYYLLIWQLACLKAGQNS